MIEYGCGEYIVLECDQPGCQSHHNATVRSTQPVELRREAKALGWGRRRILLAPGQRQTGWPWARHYWYADFCPKHNPKGATL